MIDAASNAPSRGQGSEGQGRVVMVWRRRKNLSLETCMCYGLGPGGRCAWHCATEVTNCTSLGDTTSASLVNARGIRIIRCTYARGVKPKLDRPHVVGDIDHEQLVSRSLKAHAESTRHPHAAPCHPLAPRGKRAYAPVGVEVLIHMAKAALPPAAPIPVHFRPIVRRETPVLLGIARCTCVFARGTRSALTRVRS